MTVCLWFYDLCISLSSSSSQLCQPSSRKIDLTRPSSHSVLPQNPQLAWNRHQSTNAHSQCLLNSSSGYQSPFSSAPSVVLYRRNKSFSPSDAAISSSESSPSMLIGI